MLILIYPISGKWSHWNDHLNDYKVPDINPISYGSLLIPNVSSIRTDFLIRSVTGIQRLGLKIKY